MRARLLILLAILSAVAGAFWPRGGGTAIVAPARGSSPHSPEPAVPARRDAAGDRQVVAPVAASGAVAGPGAPSPPGMRVRVQVIDAGSGAAVPHARVAVLGRAFARLGGDAAARARVQRFGADRFGLLAHFGAVEYADGDGSIEVRCDDLVFLASEDHGRYGELTLRASELDPAGGHRLLLAADAGLTVRVVDAAGRPLPGLPLALESVMPDGERGAANPQAGALPWAYTGADGTATLHHLPRFVADCARRGLPVGRAGVRLSIAGVDGFAFVFDPREPPTGVVEIRAPATGVVCVRLRDARGEPSGDGDDLVLRTADEPARLWTGEPAGAAAARFAYVAVGRALLAASRASDTVAPQTVPGPTYPGEVVEVELRAPLATPVLAGLVTDADLRPLPHARIAVPFRGENFGADAALAATTAADGRFRYEFAPQMVGETITLTFVQLRDGQANTPSMLALERTLTIETGTMDLGVLALQRAPLLATGRVTVDGAAPAQRPDLIVEVREGAAWAPLPSATFEWLEAGCFELRGLPGGADLRLSASARDCPPAAPLAFAPGARELHVALRSGGSLRVELRLDDARFAEQLVCEVTPEEPSADRLAALRAPEREQTVATAEASTAAWTWRGLVAGRYRMSVLAAGGAAPLLSLPGLEVDPGTTCSDPRLRGLDLRARLTAVTLRVFDADGAPARYGIVFGAGAGRLLGATILDGRARVVLSGPSDLRVAVRGCAIAELPGVHADQTVNLRTLPTRAVALPAIDTPEGTKLFLTAEPGGLPLDAAEVLVGDRRDSLRRHSRPSSPRVALGEAQVAQFPARPEETLRLRVWLEAGTALVEVAESTPQHLPPAAAGEPAVLVVPAAAVQAAAARLRRPP